MHIERWRRILLFFLLGTVNTHKLDSVALPPHECSTTSVICCRCDAHSILRFPEKPAARTDCLRIKKNQHISRLVSRIRGGKGDDPSKDSSFADEDKALIQKLLRQQVVSAKTEKKKEKRSVLFAYQSITFRPPHPHSTPTPLHASRIRKGESPPQKADARRP